MAHISGLDNACLDLVGMKQPQISDLDILHGLRGLIAELKTAFDQVREFVEDFFFQDPLEFTEYRLL